MKKREKSRDKMHSKIGPFYSQGSVSSKCIGRLPSINMSQQDSMASKEVLTFDSLLNENLSDVRTFELPFCQCASLQFSTSPSFPF